jgi:hypothetical protein
MGKYRQEKFKRLPNKKISYRFKGRGQGGGEGKVVVKFRNWIIYFLEFPNLFFWG